MKITLTFSRSNPGVLDFTPNPKNHLCKGRNDCKGKGGCRTGDRGCAGKNTCKARGGCAVKDGKPIR